MHIEVDGVISLLNHWLRVDAIGITSIFAGEAVINDDLAAERRLSAKQSPHDESEEVVEHRIEVLDIINGLFGGRRIEAVRNERGGIIKFQRAS